MSSNHLRCNVQSWCMVAVGTAVARRPPHGSRRAELPHRALASDQTRDDYSSHVARTGSCCRSSGLRNALLSRLCVRSTWVAVRRSLWPGSFPPSSPRAGHAAVVRGLRGYYGPVRLPAAVHRRRVLVGSRRGPAPKRRSAAGSPGFRTETLVSFCEVLACVHGVFDPAGPVPLSRGERPGIAFGLS